MSVSKYVVLVSSLALLANCRRDTDQGRADRADRADPLSKSPAGAASGSGRAADYGVAKSPGTMGGDSGQRVASAVPQGSDSTGDAQFLRSMVNQQESLIQLASTAMTRAAKSSTKGDAREVHSEQMKEQKQLIAQLKKLSPDSVTPMPAATNLPANDSTQAQSGVAFDREFYREVVSQYRQIVQMVDDALPRLTKPEVKRLAEKMKTDHEKDIAAYERKAQGVT